MTQAAKINRDFGKIPLHFEANQGQTDPQVKFLSRGPGHGLFLTPTEAVMTLQQGFKNPLPPGEGRVRAAKNELSHIATDGNLGNRQEEIPVEAPSPQPSPEGRGSATTLRLKLQGANPAPQLAGLDEQPGKSHYFIGNDPSQWRKHVSNYAKVAYDEVYPGIDLVYYGNQRQLEYDFIVAPNADPKTIKLAIEGADKVSIDPDGNLILSTPNGEIRQHKPIVYQDINGQRKTLEGRYVMLDDVGAGSEPAPTGNTVEISRHTGMDCRYPEHREVNLDYPPWHLGSGNPCRNDGETFVADSKAPLGNPVLQALLDKSAPIGSMSFSYGIPKQELGNEQINHLPSGEGRVRGNLQIASIGFEVAEYDHTQPLVIDPVLVYSTYLGGSGGEHGQGITVDADGYAYIVGGTYSANFPITPGSLQQTYAGGSDGYGSYRDGFVTKLSPDGSTLVYSTYIGGAANIDEADDVNVDKEGNAFIVGTTRSSDFPVTPGAINAGGRAFVLKLDSSGSHLIYSAKLGDGGQGLGIAIDPTGNAYATGDTWSQDIPVTPNAPQQRKGGGARDAFVVKLNATGTAVIYGTYIGGNGNEYGSDLTIDSDGKTYVVGWTTSSNFPIANPLQSSFRGGVDVFITVINPEGTQFIFSSYLGGTGDDGGGGIAVDKEGRVLVTGNTSSNDFPTQSALQPKFGGAVDAFLTKIDIIKPSIIFSTYWGGASEDHGNNVEVDASGSAYFTGDTASTDFPLKNPIQSKYAGGGNSTLGAKGDLFLTKINNTGSKMLFSTYLGGKNAEWGYCCHMIAVDPCGDVYLTGETHSSDFPLQSPMQAKFGGDFDAFVSKILFDDSADLSLSKSASPDPIITGNQLTYHLTVNNLCSKDATGVKVSDVLPAQFAYIRATSTQGLCSAQDGKLNCELGKLGPKGSADITVLGTARAPASVILKNQASVSADQEDVDPRNNIASASVQLRTALGVLGNDSDSDGDMLNAKLLATTAHGTLSLNPDGSFTYAPQAGFNGVDTFTYQANDGKLDSNVATVTINVARTNHAPSILSTAPTSGTPIQAYGYQLKATDPDTGDTLAYSLPQAPAGMGINPATGAIQWTPTVAQIGRHTVTVQVQDSGGITAAQSFAVTVTVANHPPAITSTSPLLEPVAGGLYRYEVTALDLDVGDVLTYSLPYAPAGMGIDPATGVILWTPTLSQIGEHPVTVWVTDAGGLFAEQSFTVTVIDQAPVITSTPNVSQWVQMNPTGTPPQPGAARKPAYDEINDRLIMFGGDDNTQSPRLNHVWVLANATARIGEPSWIKLNPQGTLPTGRIWNSVAYDSTTNRLIVYSGIAGEPQPALNDTWVLTHANGLGGQPEWIQLPSGLYRFGAAAGYDPASNRMVVFGGTDESGRTDYNNVRVLLDANGIGSPAWINLSPIGTPPSPRGTNISASYDPISNRMIIVGGFQSNPRQLYDDVWVLKHANGLGGTPEWIKLAPTGTPPADRLSHGVQYDSNTNRLILFGGENGKDWDKLQYFNDTWILTHANGEGGTPEWKPLSLSNNAIPGVRSSPSLGYSPVTNRMVLTNGSHRTAPAFLAYNDAWLLINANGNCVIGQPCNYDVDASDLDAGDTLTFSLVSAPEGMTIDPVTGSIQWNPNLDGHYSVTVKVTDKAGLSATQTFSVEVINTNHAPTITSTPNVSKWTELHPTGILPSSRTIEGNNTYDWVNDRLIIFGGSDYVGSPPTNFNEVWVLVNATMVNGLPSWIKLNPIGGLPPVRVLHTAVYDPTANRLIVHGGCEGHCGRILNDTWVLTNANGLGGTPEWIQLPSAMARGGHIAGYDPVSNRMMIYGGNTGVAGGNLYDTRVLIDANGIGNPQWVSLTTASSLPPPSSLVRGKYDALSNRLILFGGGIPGQVLYNDVWVLSNANGLGGTPTWTKLEPTGFKPASRLGHTVEYDPNSNQLIVHGGRVNASAPFEYPSEVSLLTHANGLGGTPEWKTLQTSIPMAPGRCCVGYSSATNRMVTTLGIGHNDTWLLTNASGNCTANQPCNYDVDATDPDAGDSLTFALASSPQGMGIDAVTGQINWTPTPEQTGTQNVRVIATDSKGLTATQTFQLTVSSVAVPNVVGLAPEWGEAMFQAAGLNTGAKSSLGGAVRLNFDTLPSQQGWEYRSEIGGSGAPGVPESTVFSVDKVLQQNTLGRGELYSWYQHLDIINNRMPFNIQTRARVITDESGPGTRYALEFNFETGKSEAFGITIGTQEVKFQSDIVIATLDGTAFHDYDLSGTPAGNWKLLIDGNLTASGLPFHRDYPNRLLIGDGTRGYNAKAEIAAYSFTQPQIATQNPAPGTLVNLGSAVDLGIQEGPATQTVPDVAGQAQADAQTAIVAAGLLVGNVTTEASNTVPASSVIRQKPVAGTHIMKNFKVDVVLSSSPTNNASPVITSTPVLQATVGANYAYAVNATDSNTGDVLTYSTTTAPIGLLIDSTTGLISWNPTLVQVGANPVVVRVQDQTGLSAMQSFTITVAAIIVPSVVGLTEAAAKSAITALNLNIGTVAQTPSDTIPAGQVISQNPAAGTPVAQGQSVNLVVSSGTVLVSVPNLVGLSQASAQVALLAANLSLGTVAKQYSATVPAGQVISQSPLAGSSASPGSAVNLVVSLGVASISVPDVVGKIRSDAETALTAASLAVGTVTERDNRVSLAFNTLPSPQGWKYFAYGNNKPETGVFSLVNGLLHQNTIGVGFAASSGNRYDLYDVIRTDQPFALNLTARVTRQEGDATDAFGFIFGVMTGSEQFVFGIGSNGVQDSYGNFIVANIDTRQFHQFRMVATPKAGYQLFIDNRLVASGSGLPLDPADNNAYLLFGDASGASNAEADVSSFSFRQGAGLVLAQNPAAAVMVGPNAPVDLLLAQKPASVAVPNAVNLPQANAEASLIIAGLNIGTVNTAISDTVPAGQVISQTPAAGTTVELESAVNLTVSSGVLKVSVPNLVGLTETAATAALASTQLIKGTVSQSNSDTVPAGQIISQTPAAGVSIAKGSAVSLVVSSGLIGISVPNVVGMTEAAALAALQSANLKLGNKTQSYSDTVAAGQVISQDPPAAASVAKGSAVALVVSLGALPAPISGIHVEPGTGLLVTGDTLSFIAQGILADGSAIPLAGLVWASSDLGVASIDANGIITARTAGTVTVSAKLGSIIGTATLTVKAATPGDVAYPTAQITAPTDNANLTEPVAVTGTATDANFLKYVLEIAPVGSNNFTTLNTGTAPVANGVLGTLDTTLLQNDLYTLRLTVYDRANNRQESSVQVQVSRELKVGNFTVAFQDVSVPMACMPLTVTRVYDSRDKQKGDFGVGWHLEVNTLKLRESNEIPLCQDRCRLLQGDFVSL